VKKHRKERFNRPAPHIFQGVFLSVTQVQAMQCTLKHGSIDNESRRTGQNRTLFQIQHLALWCEHYFLRLVMCARTKTSFSLETTSCRVETILVERRSVNPERWWNIQPYTYKEFASSSQIDEVHSWMNPNMRKIHINLTGISGYSSEYHRQIVSSIINVKPSSEVHG
jgi:hypothetical protein